jgi:centromere protein I
LSIRAFLKSYLQIWNGKDNRDHVFRLLQFIPIQLYETLRAEFLLPLESAVLDEGLSSRTALLDFYSALIGQWGVKLRSQQDTTEESVDLSQVVVHAELLASSILEFPVEDEDKKSKPATVSVLDFYRALSEIFSLAPQDSRFRLTLPYAQTVYTLAFTPSVAVISGLTSILAVYKSAFEASLNSQVLQAQNAPAYSTDLVGRFNGYVMDMCNVLWRNRALNTEDPNALGCLVPATTTTALTHYVKDVSEAAKRYDRESAFHITLASIFSLSHHAAFCNLSAACFADLEDQQISDQRPRLRKPVTQKVLQALEKDGGAKITWQEYRVHMLDWLDAIGCRGTGILMRSTMKALRKE